MHAVCGCGDQNDCLMAGVISSCELPHMCGFWVWLYKNNKLS